MSASCCSWCTHAGPRTSRRSLPCRRTRRWASRRPARHRMDGGSTQSASCVAGRVELGGMCRARAQMRRCCPLPSCPEPRRWLQPAGAAPTPTHLRHADGVLQVQERVDAGAQGGIRLRLQLALQVSAAGAEGAARLQARQGGLRAPAGSSAGADDLLHVLLAAARRAARQAADPVVGRREGWMVEHGYGRSPFEARPCSGKQAEAAGRLAADGWQRQGGAGRRPPGQVEVVGCRR